MSSFARGSFLLAGTLSLSVLVSCAKHHQCEGPELCNYADDDCDGDIDEDFLNADGLYLSNDNCNTCGVRCGDTFPTAAETECVVDPETGGAMCRIVRCPVGSHLAGVGACVADSPVLCLTCTTNEDCQSRNPNSQCVELSAGDLRCLENCGDSCAEGFHCNDAVVCEPDSSDCSCTSDRIGLAFGCTFARDDGYTCTGSRICEATGLSTCAPALDEVCNGADDNCDGQVDETFRDSMGRYAIDPLHCGACNQPCAEPGPNMVATCTPSASAAECVIVCEAGFVDVDGLAANGCECERFDGSGPPPAIGADANCDGTPDDNTGFIYVSSTGNDAASGSLAHPVRSIQAGITLGQTQNKSVLVSRGLYDGRVDLVSGVSVFGGYRPDFRDRDLTLYPVVLERSDASPGTPVLTCNAINVATRMEGITVQGADATTSGAGSSAAYFNNCGPNVTLASVVILAGRGASGTRGNDSSDNLGGAFASLTDLNGTNGSAGHVGTSSSALTCTPIQAGAGGTHVCGGNVSGGNGGGASCPALGCTNGSPCGNAGCTDYTTMGVCDLNAALANAVANPAGQPGQGTSAGLGGAATYNAPTNRAECNFCDDNPTLPRLGENGTDGSPGTNGSGGVGCTASPSLAVGTGLITGGSGTDGTSGTDGSGGGGGSSGSGYAVIGGTVGVCSDRAGGSGGGGGSGGCGAPAASAGTGGGTSVGLVIRLSGGLTSGPTLDNVRIVTASGGSGGDGGNGATGGGPGAGAPGGATSYWCARAGGRGGDGGNGGNGGGGGGGCGGGSHGVYVAADSNVSAYVTTLSTSATIDETGVPGRGGRAGFSPSGPGGNGADGPGASIYVP